MKPQKSYLTINTRQLKFPFFLILLILFPVFIISSCGDDEEEVEDPLTGDPYLDAVDCTNEIPTFAINIQPIIDASCATSLCHNNESMANDMTMEGYDNAKTACETFNVLCAINQDNSDCVSMPLNADKLSDKEILAISCWMKNDFPE